MRVFLSACAASLALAACGGDEGSNSPADKLQGIWGVESNSDECVYAISFDDNTFEMLEFCELDDGSYGAESYVGTYVLNKNGDMIGLTIDRSSCADADRAWSAAVAFPGENLRLTTPDGVLLMEPITSKNSSTGNAAVAFGCFDDEGYFNPSPIRDL